MPQPISKAKVNRIVELHKDSQLSIRKIAKIVGCGDATVSHYIRVLHLPARTPGQKLGFKPWNKGKVHLAVHGNKYAFLGDRAKPNTLNRRARKILLHIKKCQICGKKKKSFQMVVHHIDENVYNNTLTNLMKLCRSCHIKIHRDKLQKSLKNKKHGINKN